MGNNNFPNCVKCRWSRLDGCNDIICGSQGGRMGMKYYNNKMCKKLYEKNTDIMRKSLDIGSSSHIMQ